MFTNHQLQNKPEDLITSTPDSLLKLLVFEVDKLTLALPIEQTKKVVKYTSVHGSGLNHINLAHLDDREVTIVDLEQKLFKHSQAERNNFDGYFIITKDVMGESIGILVSKMPILIDVPLSQIRLLPNSYRHSDTLEIASHVTLITQKNKPAVTIFIVDLDRLI
ncbi:MAG: chemotaxis protein CheW [Xenococcaceae cyanobacterium MO_188.B32]|nr:chemotaxis protein CheW [Xenococcaceae cyanobacterium MO_188.B32]